MELNIAEPAAPLPTDRAWVVTIAIRSFKGRRDVMVNIFRPKWNEAEEKDYNWDALIGGPHPDIPVGAELDPLHSRKIVLEAFTASERDQVIAYLKERYADRLPAIEAAPMDFPIPLGLTPLSEIPEGQDIGVIRFEKIPNYNLSFPIHGLYDLSLHKPITMGEE